MLKHMNVWKKQALGFLLIALIIITVALTGHFGIRAIRQNFNLALASSPLIDAAMEMKLSVATDRQIIMEFLSSRSLETLEGYWKEHQELVRNFDTYAGAEGWSSRQTPFTIPNLHPG